MPKITIEDVLKLTTESHRQGGIDTVFFIIKVLTEAAETAPNKTFTILEVIDIIKAFENEMLNQSTESQP